MSSSYNEFRAEVLKLSQPKKFKITKTLHSKYIIRSIRKKYKESHIVSEDIYSQIIRRINELLIPNLFENGSLKLPHKMGMIRIMSYKSDVYIKDGELKRTTSFKWKETLALWHENEKARAKKILIRGTPQPIYSIKWYWRELGFKNKQYYKFIPCRALKLKLKDIINSKGVPSYERRTFYNYKRDS